AQSRTGGVPGLAAGGAQQPRQIDLTVLSTLRSSSWSAGSSPALAAPCPPPPFPDDCAVPSELVPGELAPGVLVLEPVVPGVDAAGAEEPPDGPLPTCACAEAVASVTAERKTSVRRRACMAKLLLSSLRPNSRRAPALQAASS